MLNSIEASISTLKSNALIFFSLNNEETKPWTALLNVQGALQAAMLILNPYCPGLGWQTLFCDLFVPMTSLSHYFVSPLLSPSLQISWKNVKPKCLFTQTQVYQVTSDFSRSISISPSSICCRSCLATVFSVSTIWSRWRYFCMRVSCSVARFL